MQHNFYPFNTTMYCPKCGNADTKVVDSRVIENGLATRRRRECEHCNYRFTTFERRGSTDIMVTKKDGTKELYDRSKLKKAILLSFAKRDLSTDTIDTMIAELESDWSKLGNTISSEQIGADVLKALKDIDPVAYVRFASVYLQFDTLEDFQDVMK